MSPSRRTEYWVVKYPARLPDRQPYERAGTPTVPYLGRSAGTNNVGYVPKTLRWRWRTRLSAINWAAKIGLPDPKIVHVTVKPNTKSACLRDKIIYARTALVSGNVHASEAFLKQALEILS